MDVSGDLPRCPECGEPMERADRGCPHCKPSSDGTDVHSTDLKVLSGQRSGRDPVAARDVRLVRQVKMPTVDALADDGAALDRLPSKVCAMEDAIGTGDLRAANRLMDDAMGSLLKGPGYRGRSRRRLLPVVLWVCCGILVLLAVLAWWLR